jgi:hypothetical protein
MEDKLYGFNVSSCSLFMSWADTAHSFAQLYLHPWITGGLLVVMVSVPGLWIDG